MGKKAPTGEIFTREDLDELIRQEHELACHTYDHYDAWDTAPFGIRGFYSALPAGHFRGVAEQDLGASLIPSVGRVQKLNARLLVITNALAAADRLLMLEPWT